MSRLAPLQGEQIWLGRRLRLSGEGTQGDWPVRTLLSPAAWMRTLRTSTEAKFPIEWLHGEADSPPTRLGESETRSHRPR